MVKGSKKVLVFFRALIAILCVSYISVFFANIPVFFKRMATECITKECLAAPGPPPSLESLQKIGMNEQSYALFYTAADSLFILGFLTAGFIVYWRRGSDIMGLLCTVLLVSFGTTFPSLMSVAGENNQFLLSFNGIMLFLGWGSLCFFFFLFPNGRFEPRWTLWLLIPIVAIISLGFIETPFWVILLRVFLVFAILLFVQIYRFRKISSSIERQQTKWVVYGFALTTIGYLSLVFIPLLLNPNIFTEGSTLYFMVFNSLIYLSMLVIPITLTFALLRRRLWDIDPIINRTFVYAIMTLVVIGIYVAVVWYLSNLFKTTDNIVISIVATSIVAVSFSPIKERLQQTIVRRMYGEQGNPFLILALLGKEMKEMQTPEQVLDQITSSLKEVLRLPYSSITIFQEDEEIVLSQHGDKRSTVLPLPINYRGALLGYLNVSHRSPGEAFTKADERLWEVLIQQLGPLLQDLKATIDLKILNSELQASRERLVLAREEERQYLRRNLHDDLAPRLAALAYTAAAAEELVEKEPNTVKVLLAEHQQMILGTVHDIRRLVYDLRPPSIDELGLVEALRQRLDEIYSSIKANVDRVVLNFEAPEEMPCVPPAVEVAVYRIITEAVVNVVRHSKAKECLVKLMIINDRLELEVIDNGIGFSGKKKLNSMGGLGVPSMKERAAELGGECVLEHRGSGGTRVYAWIPLTANNMGEAE